MSNQINIEQYFEIYLPKSSVQKPIKKSQLKIIYF